MSNLNTRFPHYSKLLKLYPKPYRDKYERQMQQTLADMLDDPHASNTEIWARAAIDLPVSLARQQLVYFGGIMTHEMPTYVKRNAIIAAAMLAPFFLALSANGLDKVINDRTLLDSWLWGMPALAIWVLWLPMAAAVFALASLMVFLLLRAKAEHISWFKALLAIQYNWPLLVVGGLGLLILFAVFFHDSVHCVTGNPIREARNLHQTWRCIQQR